MTHALSSPPIRARLFLSWAHDDKALKELMLKLLMPRLKIIKGFQFAWWEDSHIRTGEAWRRSILKRLDECDYGLQLLSPNFFASSFIVNEELPPFIGNHPKKEALPVGLIRVPLDGTADLHGVDRLQLQLQDGKFFGELAGPARVRFADRLADEIRKRLIDEDPWQLL